MTGRASQHLAGMRPAHVFLCAAIVFVVYGSLFPFDFQSQEAPFAALFAQWNPFQDRADAVDNILLFVPLGLSLHFAFDSPRTRVGTVVLVWIVLGLGLQWVQLFVPGRVASLADAINNAIGLGVGLWTARRIAPWLQARPLIASTGDRFALLLVLAWYAYESFPFLPTLDIGLLRDHLKQALQPQSFDVLRLVRHLLAAALGTMLLLRAQPLQPRSVNVPVAAAVVLLSELLVPYGGLRVETLIGIVLGIVLGDRVDRFFGARLQWIVMLLALAALATTILTPFRGQPADAGFTLTPFSGLLWYGNTSGIPPAAFEALTIGALLWSGLGSDSKASRLSRHWPWAVLALLVVGEWIRVRLLGYRGDTTTLVLWLILAPVAHLTRRPATSTSADRTPEPAAAHDSTRSGAETASSLALAFDQRARVALHAGIGMCMLTVGLWLAVQLPTIPYNVKELFESRELWRFAPFAAALLWLGWGPWWVAITAARSRAGAAWLPALLFAASMVSLLMLNLSVTQESLDDIVGSPDLYRRVTMDGLWGAEWSARLSAWPQAPLQFIERAVRFAALYGLLLVPLTIVAMHLCGRWALPRKCAGVAVAALTWWLAKLVVVDWAITDNLTELIARGGVPYLAMILALLAANVGALAASVGVLGRLAGAAATGFLVPATWWLLQRGLEPVLVKYGVVFAAAQFLLGQNRSMHLSDWQLFGRWAFLYLAAAVVLAWGMRLANRFATASMAAQPGNQMPGQPLSLR